MIIRVFLADIVPGKEEEFKSFFLDQALPMIKAQKGLIEVMVGLPINPSSQLFMMSTTWKDLESLKQFAGENWEDAVIDDEERHLLLGASVDHFFKHE